MNGCVTTAGKKSRPRNNPPRGVMPKELKVRDAMVKKVVVVSADTTVQVAAILMAKNRVGCLIVHKNNGPLGIVTESDIIKKTVSRNVSPDSLKVSDIMTTPIVFVTPDQSLDEVSRTMSGNRIRRLPVIENGRVVGILAHTDVVRVSPEMFALLNERIRMRENDFYLTRREDRVPAGGRAGLCENCGRASADLGLADDDWLCEKCSDTMAKQSTPRKTSGFRAWSRMG